MFLAKFRKQIENEDRYFNINASGNILFSPWGKNFISYVVDKEKKNKILDFLSLFYAVLFFYSMTAFLLNYFDIYAPYLLISANAFGWVIFPLWYYKKVKYFTSDKDYVNEKVGGLPSTFYLLLVCLIFHLLIIVIGLNVYHNAQLFIGGVIVIHSAYIFIILWLIRLSFKLNNSD